MNYNNIYVDFNDAGHHPRHLEHVLSLEGGVVLTSVCARRMIRESVVQKTKMKLVVIDIKPNAFDEHISLILSWYADERKNLASNCAIIHLAIDDIYPALLKILICGPIDVPLNGIWMACNTFYTRKLRFSSKIKFWGLFFSWVIVFNLLLPRRSRIYFLNEELNRWLKLVSPILFDHWVRWAPDPPDLPAVVAHEKSSDRCFDLAFLGLHSKRKGTIWAIEALRYWQGQRLNVLIAGVVEQRERLASAIPQLPSSIKIILYDRYLCDTELQDLIIQSKIVCAPYNEFGGSSGIVVNALSLGTKVLVPQFGVLGSRIGKIDTRMTFAHNDIKSYLDAISVLTDVDTLPKSFVDYCRLHSVTNYLRTISE